MMESNRRRGGDLEKFIDLVEGPNIKLGVIVSDPVSVRFFDSCIASKAAEMPFDITDPENYEIEEEMVIVYVFVPDFRGPEVVRLDNLQLAELHPYDFTGFYDHVTNDLRERLSVKKLAEDFWKKDREERKRMI